MGIASEWSEAAERVHEMVSFDARGRWKLVTSSWVVDCRHCILKGILHDQPVFQSRAHQPYRLERRIPALAVQCDSGKRG